MNPFHSTEASAQQIEEQFIAHPQQNGNIPITSADYVSQNSPNSLERFQTRAG
jgi:hypothetical protein